MPLYGITHTLDGLPVSKLAKTLKVGFGYTKGPAVHAYIDGKTGQYALAVGVGKQTIVSTWPDKQTWMKGYWDARKTAPERKFPGKFPYFTFQRIRTDANFAPDFDAIEMHGPAPTEVQIVFLGNDPLQQEMQWWTAAELKCHGDGRNALRRVTAAQTAAEKKLAQDAMAKGEQWFPIIEGCFTRGCPYAKANGDKAPLCKPHTRLEFQLANAPALGSTCTYDSTGFRSASQLWSSLQQIRTITGRGNPEQGVVAGIPITLKLLPYKTSHNGTPSLQYGVTLYLKAADALDLIRNTIAKGDEWRAQLGAARLQLEAAQAQIEPATPEEAPALMERLTEAAEAQQMTGEFYADELGEDDEIPVELGGEWMEEPEQQAQADPVEALPMPQRKSRAKAAATEDVITEEQANDLYACAMGIPGWDAARFQKWLSGRGYARLGEVPSSKFSGLVAELQKEML